MNFITQNQISEVNIDQSPVKILALHGGGETSASLSSQAGIVSLMGNLPEVEFVFANAPSNNLWIQDPPGGKGDPTTDPDWADDSIAYLDNFVSREGPFLGILGYSQGAAFIPVYLANTSNTFDIAVMSNGYLPTTHQGLMSTINFVAPFEITSLIFSGENDYGFKDLAEGLADLFNNSINVRSSMAGHHLPFESDPAFQELLNFITENSSLVSAVTEGQYSLTAIANVFGSIMFLDGLTETVTSTSHTIEYNGTTFDYAEVDGIITTVVRDGEFTSEFAAEIAESFPDSAGISYSTAVALIGQANIESTLLMVAGADGNYVG